MTEKKSGLFSKIQNFNDAQKMTKDAAYGFYFLAVIQAGIGLFIAPVLIIEGIIYLILAFFLHKFKSRLASVLLLLLSGLALASTLQNKFADGGEGGMNLILAVVMVGIAIRAVEASFKYHKYKATA